MPQMPDVRTASPYRGVLPTTVSHTRMKFEFPRRVYQNVGGHALFTVQNGGFWKYLVRDFSIHRRGCEAVNHEDS